MSESSEFIFRKALKRSLDKHFPEWTTRHNYQAGQDPPLGVWPETIWDWVKGKHFPQLKRFLNFISENSFSEETRKELLELYKQAAAERKWVFGRDESSTQKSLGKGESDNLYNSSEMRDWMLYKLPQPTTSFVERPNDLEKVIRLLRNPDCRLLTLTGFPGVGKTRLAIAAASVYEKESTVSDRVRFIPLAHVDSPELIISTIAKAIGLIIDEDYDQEYQIMNKLYEQDMLLVLENCENLIENLKIITNILNNTSKIKFLLTSQEPVKLQGEQIVIIEGMGKKQAIKLFLNTATKINANFVLSNKQRVVAKICQKVGYLPLAIELAAGWVDTLNCEEILKEIEQSLDFLKTDVQKPERHKSLRAAFEYSWKNLKPEDRLIFAGLSMFQGPFSRRAAEYVAEAKPANLQVLFNKSLIRKKNQRHYEILEALRWYGQEKLNENPEEKKYRQNRHCDYYADFLQSRQSKIEGDEQDKVSIEINEEIENIRLAWNWAAEQGRETAINKSMTTLVIFYDIQNWYQEGREIFKKAKEGLEKNHSQNVDVLVTLLGYQMKFSRLLSNYAQVEEAHNQIIKLVPPGENKIQADIHDQNGKKHYDCAEYSQAQYELEKSLSILRTLGEHDDIARVLRRLGDVASATSNFAMADARYSESYSIYEANKDRRGQGQCLAGIGDLRRKEGRYLEAEQQLQQAQERFPRRDKKWKGIVLVNLARVLGSLNQFEQAKHYCLEALSIFTSPEHGSPWQIQFTRNHLGWILYLNREYEEAERLLKDNVNNSDDPLHKSFGLTYLGYIYLALGKLNEAQKSLCKALSMANEELEAMALEASLAVGNYSILMPNKEFGVNIITFIVNYGKTEFDTKQRGQKLLEEVNPQMNPQAFVSAQAQGENHLSFQELIKQIGSEFCQNL